MGRPRLIIVCGIPGSGKSTFALRVADRWGAVKFASETFAEQLGATARTASGDLTKKAIAHAYSAMGAAVADALASNKLVIAVGSFRSEKQRSRFRAIAKSCGASVTTLRVVCPVKTAAKRIRIRLALVLANDSSMEDFHRGIDAVLEPLILDASTKTNDRRGWVVV